MNDALSTPETNALFQMLHSSFKHNADAQSSTALYLEMNEEYFIVCVCERKNAHGIFIFTCEKKKASSFVVLWASLFRPH